MYDCSGKQHIPFLTLLAQRKSRKSVVYQRVCAICTFALTHSRIPTAKTYHFVTMYYSHPRRLAKSPIAKQNLSHRANVICDGSLEQIFIVEIELVAHSFAEIVVVHFPLYQRKKNIKSFSLSKRAFFKLREITIFEVAATLKLPTLLLTIVE